MTKKISEITCLTYASVFLAICSAAGLPKYQAIVYPQLFNPRQDGGIRVLKLGEDITLNLKQSSDLPEDFFLRTYRQGIAQYRYFDVEALQENLYHDERAVAAVMLTDEDGTLQVEGVVGPNLRIKPIEGAERAQGGSHPHLIETIEDPGDVYGKTVDSGPPEITSRSGFDPEAYKVTKIYPEVFMVCDTKFRGGFKSEKSMIDYLLIVMKVINIRYQTVTKPEVEIIFRGVEVKEATYYEYVGGEDIDGYKSLLKIGGYLQEHNKSYGAYDLVYFMTGYDMVVVQGGVIERSIAGYAFVASACTSHRHQLGEDTPKSYRSIRIAAHEMAHTLGCPHDGSTIDGIVRAFKPDATKCPWDDNYIMSYIEKDSRSMKFSSCCIYNIARMTWSRDAACLRRPDSYTTLKNRTKTIRLPGELLSKTKQCQISFPELWETYFMAEFGAVNCKAECYVPGKQFHASDGHWSIFLLDGTPCGDNSRRCKNGDCVHMSGKFKTPREKTRQPKRTTEYYTWAHHGY